MAVDRSKPKRRALPPPLTPEEQENQLIFKAMNLVEQQIDEGTASAQVLTHFLKLGSTREQLEQERLRQDNELLKAKVEQLQANSRMEEIYTNAILAMRSYQGVDDETDYDGQD